MVSIPTSVRTDFSSQSLFQSLDSFTTSRDNYVGGRVVWFILSGCGPLDPSSNLGLRPFIYTQGNQNSDVGFLGFPISKSFKYGVYK